MLIIVDDLKEQYPDFKKFNDELLERKIKSIERTIRKHTNNNFQNRLVRFNGSIKDGVIQATSPYLRMGDTLQISDGVNKGLYTVRSVKDVIKVEEPLYDYPEQLFTKVEYPIDVVEGAIGLLDWELIRKGKENTGVASETVSRHSVSYVQRTNDNMIDGYPIELFNFCNEYMKARF